MKKVIAYTEDQIAQLKAVLNAITVTGIQNAMQLSYAAQIIDSGLFGEFKEPEKKEGE